MRTILLVDDDAAIRDSFSLVLDKKKYRLLSYADGQAILSSEAECPDLFILDKNLPHVKGTELCLFIKNSSKYKGVPVVIISADPDVMEQAEIVCADDAIEKPFSLKTLKELIAKYVPERVS